MGEDGASALCRAIAAQGLPDAAERRPAPVDQAVWERVLARVRWERISGLAVESVAAGWLELSDEQLDALLELHREAMAWSLSVERKIIGLAEVFGSEGIGFAVLKGASVAHTAYLDPSLRSFGDLDVLVRTGDYQRACALLEALEHVRLRPEPRPGFEVRFGKASVHRHPDDQIEVDLHRTLVIGPFGLWIRPEELLDRSASFDLGGRRVPRLDDTGMLLNVAMHASLGFRPPRLAPLRDVAEVTRRCRVEWDVLADWASRWRLSAVLGHAFLTASETLGTPVAEEAVAFTGSSPPRREVRALAAYTGAGRNEGGTAVGTMRAIPGVRGKAAYAFALAFPGREFLAARSRAGDGASYLRRLAIPLRWGRSRLPGANGASRGAEVRPTRRGAG